MNNISIFNQQYPAGTTRIVKSQDGVSEVYCRHAIGEINGESRSIPALVCTGFSTEDKWAIVSLTSGLNNLKYVCSVAILGANDSEQAEDWAKRYFGLYAGASGAQFTGFAGAQALQLLLDNPASAENLPIRNASICKYEGLVSLSPVVWNDDQLTSPVLAKLVHEMGLLDTHGQLLDPVTVADLPILVNEIGGVHQEYDALIVDYSKMDLLAQRLNAAMSKASVGDIKPINLTQTKPFKRNGVTNIAMVFELSDGQSVTIVFHNPDSTPTKLAAHDTMTSWKWMLNKRDVTAAVSPKEGDNVQLPVLAKRILTLVEKNSARFKRANATKDSQVKELTTLIDRVASKQTELEVVLGEIKLLEEQIDGAGKAQVSAEPIQHSIHYSEQILNALVSNFGWKHDMDNMIMKTFEDLGADGDLANGARTLIAKFDEKGRYLALSDQTGATGGLIVTSTEVDCRPYMDDPEKGAAEFNKRVNDYVEGERAAAQVVEPVIAEGMTSRDDLIPQVSKRFNDATVSDVLVDDEAGNVVATVDGKKNVEAGFLEDYEAANAAESSVYNPDAEYLHAIIGGSADMTQGDAMQAELEAIAERLTPEIEPLFEKAVDVYAAYQVAQASALV